MTRLALVFPPRAADLAHLKSAIAEVDAAVVTPETTWRSPGTDFATNDYYDVFADLQGDRPRVGHAVGFGLGSFDPGEAAHHHDWLTAMRRDQRDAPVEWTSDHAVATRLAGQDVRLPVPLPLTDTLARLVRQRLLQLQRVAGVALIETSAWTLTWGDHLHAPDFYRAATDAPGLGILLDLHNLWSNSLNFGIDAEAWLARLPLDRVVEVHVSGGAWTDPAWHPGPRIRLDSHDNAVPEPVFDLLERWLPHLPSLRQVTLERMEGTLEGGGEEQVAGELIRLREAVAGVKRNTRADATGRPLPSATADDHLALEHWLADTLRGATGPRRPVRFLDELDQLNDNHLQLTRSLVARLRFERVVAASTTAGAAFARAPARFAADFRRWHVATPMTLPSPHLEAAHFARFRRLQPSG